MATVVDALMPRLRERELDPAPESAPAGDRHEPQARDLRARRPPGGGAETGGSPPPGVHGARRPALRVQPAPAREVLLAQPRGFCAGVARAIEIVERALEIHGAPVYVFHEIVHNGHVVAELAARGAVFVDDLARVPAGAVTVFSAHGVANAVVAEAALRGLRVIDATCPLVTKVHQQVQRYARAGHHVVLIGHAEHEEVVGTAGSVDVPVHVVGTAADVDALPEWHGERVAYVTQTTLSVDDTRGLIALLESRYPGISGPALDDICYATSNRQRAVAELAREVDVVLVVGARNSSNSNRLREVAEQSGVPAYLIADARAIEPAWLEGAARVGVTAGASAPEVLVHGVRQRLASLGVERVTEMDGPVENVRFRLPSLHPA